MYKILHGLAAAYLMNLMTPYISACVFRSQQGGILVIPRTKTTSWGNTRTHTRPPLNLCVIGSLNWLTRCRIVWKYLLYSGIFSHPLNSKDGRLLNAWAASWGSYRYISLLNKITLAFANVGCGAQTDGRWRKSQTTTITFQDMVILRTCWWNTVHNWNSLITSLTCLDTFQVFPLSFEMLCEIIHILVYGCINLVPDDLPQTQWHFWSGRVLRLMWSFLKIADL